MKIALAQINPTVGDVDGNKAKVLQYMGRAKELGAELVVFPELCLLGYPPRDLLERSYLIDANLKALDEIAAQAKGIAAIVGYVDRNPSPEGKSLYNAAAVLEDGAISYVCYKSLLPTYDVFDEDRYFEPAAGTTPVRFGGQRIALTICEDIWADEMSGPRKLYHKDPLAELSKKKISLIINISASPYAIGKDRFRTELVKKQAQQYGIPVLLCNQVGGNDELVFDGNSLAVDAKGDVLARAKSFEEDLIQIDLDYGAGDQHGEDLSDASTVYRALITGVRDYAHKCGFKKAVLGLSGGIDSAIVACIAREALGPENVLGVLMPGPFSSPGSISDSEQLARRLGIQTRQISIKELYESYLGKFRELFSNAKPDATEENIQARIRGSILMAISNKEGHLVLSTGNKSEIATGYCTLYGDMCGGLAVISDLPKTLIYQIATEVVNRDGEVIPNSTIEKAPSAELRPNQKDTDTLPPYNVLDPILALFVEGGKSRDEIVAAGHPAETVDRVLALVERNEYKRRQAAPGLKVTTKAFGMGRRYPIARK